VHVPTTVAKNAETLAVMARCRFEWWAMNNYTDPDYLGPDDTQVNENFTMEPLTCLECAGW